MPGGTPHPAFDAGRPCHTSDDTDASKQACVASDSSCPNRHHGALRGRGTLADGGSRGLHVTEAPPARRSVKTPFWSKGNLLTSLGWNRTRFYVQSASALQPSDRQGDQSASLRRLCLAALPLTSAQATQNTWPPSCADGLRRLLASCCSLLSSALPLLSSGFRKWKSVTNSTILFCQALRVVSQSQALCLPSENRIGEFARTLLLPSPPTAL